MVWYNHLQRFQNAKLLRASEGENMQNGPALYI